MEYSAGTHKSENSTKACCQQLGVRSPWDPKKSLMHTDLQNTRNDDKGCAMERHCQWQDQNPTSAQKLMSSFFSDSLQQLPAYTNDFQMHLRWASGLAKVFLRPIKTPLLTCPTRSSPCWSGRFRNLMPHSGTYKIQPASQSIDVASLSFFCCVAWYIGTGMTQEMGWARGQKWVGAETAILERMNQKLPVQWTNLHQGQYIGGFGRVSSCVPASSDQQSRHQTHPRLWQYPIPATSCTNSCLACSSDIGPASLIR